MISFIIPAHNEQALIGGTLRAIHEVAGGLGQAYEVIVVDDASTDATAEVAREHGASVVAVNHRQIAATRNAGGRAARGERLFFVDADTTVNAGAVKSALGAMEKGAAGGGAVTRLDGRVPLYARLMLWSFGLAARLGGITGGGFMFCTRAAFDAVGGFDERLYGGEDAVMCAALKRQGRFIVIRERVATSGRRVRAISGLKLLWNLAQMAVLGPRMLASRGAVEHIWYDSDRGQDEHVATTLGVRLSNAAALVILLMVLAFPLWMVPWPGAVMVGVVASVRFGVGVFLSHIGLLLWPCGLFLGFNLLQERQWAGRLRQVALMVVCLWLAWSSTLGVVWFWSRVYHWIVSEAPEAPEAQPTF